MQILPLAPLGAEILGLDLRQPLSSSEFEALDGALLRHKCALIRDQTLTDAEHQTFARTLGPLEEVTNARHSRDAGSPHILWVSNAREEGVTGVLEDGPMTLHIDGSYRHLPTRYTLLHALEVPTSGGDTRIVDAVMAWATLPDDLRARLRPLHATHVYDTTINSMVRTGPSDPQARRCTHPLVRVNERTGEESLFASPLMTEVLEGIPKEESQALLAQLWEHLANPELCYQHRWRVGDLLIWDNLRTLHGRTDFDPAQRRTLRRMAVAAG